MNNYFYPAVSEETFAAWLDGMLSPEEEREFMNECAHNAEIQELAAFDGQIKPRQPREFERHARGTRVYE